MEEGDGGKEKMFTAEQECGEEGSEEFKSSGTKEKQIRRQRGKIQII